MELLIMRHGPAGDREEWRKTGRPDSERPLTPGGRRKTLAAARGLRGLATADLVATSPWLRARQTADIVAKALGAPVVECASLLPSRSFEDLAAWLRARKEKRVALVGHEPHLSAFAAWLMAGTTGRSLLVLKKAQACLLEAEAPGPGKAALLWSLPPRALRALD